MEKPLGGPTPSCVRIENTLLMCMMRSEENRAIIDGPDPKRWVTEDLDRSKQVVDAPSDLVKGLPFVTDGFSLSGTIVSSAKRIRGSMSQRWVTEDLDRSKQVVDAHSDLVKELKKLEQTTTPKPTTKRLDLSKMSDEELAQLKIKLLSQLEVLAKGDKNENNNSNKQG